MTMAFVEMRLILASFGRGDNWFFHWNDCGLFQGCSHRSKKHRRWWSWHTYNSYIHDDPGSEGSHRARLRRTFNTADMKFQDSPGTNLTASSYMLNFYISSVFSYPYNMSPISVFPWTVFWKFVHKVPNLFMRIAKGVHCHLFPHSNTRRMKRKPKHTKKIILKKKTRKNESNIEEHS